jgi:calcineurin-like phosphoesterase family protein
MIPYSLSMDVGVDCHNYFPISFEKIKEVISRKQFKSVDHHKKEI